MIKINNNNKFDIQKYNLSKTYLQKTKSINSMYLKGLRMLTELHYKKGKQTEAEEEYNELKNKSENISDLLSQAISIDLDQAVPNLRQYPVSTDQIFNIIDILHIKLNKPNKAYILVGMILLFLKGAATKSTPSTLKIEVFGMTITKSDLETAVSTATGNKYVRRVAEKMAVTIGKYAEEKFLEGELAARINLLINENNRKNSFNEQEPLLTAKEKAWCSSFSTSIPNLNEYASDRLVKWLAHDYNLRFNKGIASTQKKN